METTINTSVTNGSIVEILWTMLKSLDRDVRLTLGKRLIESVDIESQSITSPTLREKIKNYKVSSFIKSLPVTGGEEVPADEDGRYALIEMKYDI